MCILRAVAYAACALLFPAQVLSQPFSTRNDFHNGQGDDVGFDIVRSDTGYTVLQFGHEPFSAFGRVCLTALDETGLVTSGHSFGVDSVSHFVGWANGLDRSNDSGYVFCGGTYNGVRNTSLFWKLTAAQDSSWVVEIFPDTADASIGNAARALPDGSFAACGSVYYSGGNGQFFLAKLDSAGSVLWTRAYGGSDVDECYSMDLCQDGGYILGGWTRSNGGFNWDMRVIKTDSAGTVQWQRALGGPYIDERANVRATSNGQYVVVGGLATHQVNVSSQIKPYAARLDSAGSVVWERTYGRAYQTNYLSTTKELSNGSFIATGLYANPDDRGVLLKFAANGDSLWMRTYQHPPLIGQFTVHRLLDVIPEAEGGFTACGTLTDSQTDLWVIRVDSFGCLVPGCQMYDHIAEQGLELHVGLYPNPAHDRVYISFRSGTEPTGTFKVVDSEGRVVRVFPPGGRSEEIDLDVRDLNVGLYLLQYEDEKGTRLSEKFMKE